MLQSWHALKLQLGRKRPGGGARRAAQHPRAGGGGYRSARGRARRRDLGPGLRTRARSLREAPGLADFSAAGVWGMRAWWFQVAAKQLPVGERGEARGRQPRPEVSAAEVCVGFLAAPPERVGGSGPPAVPRGCRGHTRQGASLGRESES